MRKPVQFALIAVAVLLAGATTLLYMKYQKTSTDYAAMKSTEESTRARYAQTIDAIAEIQDSLNAISLGEAKLRMHTNPDNEQRMSKPDQQEALDRIAELRASITRSRDRIRQLESSLHASGVKVAGLQKMIDNLKTSVSEKEEMVATLTTRVDSLQVEVTGLATTVQEREDTLRVRDLTLEDKRREIATVYYVVGNKKQLHDSGVITTKGGVLGVGKTILPSGNPDPGVFSAVDTDQQDVIHTDAKQAKVISAQPHSSYEMLLQDGQVVVHILNPDEFRKVKQLVILTG